MTLSPAALSFVGVLLSVTALLYTVFRARQGDTAGLERRLTQVETKVELFWRNVSNDAAKILHSPHPHLFWRDRLLEAFMDETIDKEGMLRLAAAMLDVFSDHEAQPGDRLAAATILRSMAMRFEHLEIDWERENPAVAREFIVPSLVDRRGSGR